MLHAAASWETPRLVLRPLAPADGPAIHQILQDPAIAATALGIPHPFRDGEAETWVAEAEEGLRQGTCCVLAIREKGSGAFIGSTGLYINPTHRRAELGYWIGPPWWGRGYATEAAARMIAIGFTELGLNRIYANHNGDNPRSGRVLVKLGLRPEGTLHEHAFHQGRFVDLVYYGLLRAEYEAQGQPALDR